MGICQNCQKHFPGLLYCPEHGIPLRSIQEEETLEADDVPVKSPSATPSRSSAPTEFAPLSSAPKSALPAEAMAATVSPATPFPKSAAARPVVSNVASPPKEPKEDLWLGQVMGNFRLKKLLGVGGMGAVYLAEHNVLPKRAAVKLLKRELAAIPEVAMRFQREAEAATGIAHENVVQIFDFGQRDDGTVYLIMELLEGKSLAALLKEEGPLSPERTGEILRPICLGLAAAHEKGIIHRDLKPDNIFLSQKLSPEGQTHEVIKILDFGIAKINDGLSQRGGPLTGTGMILGTPFYMSPEQAEGARIDLRSDIYSLGVILYEMLVGQVPFNAETFGKILLKHIGEPPRPLRKVRPDLSIPGAVEDVTLRCLSKEAQERPQDARALALLYEQALSKGNRGPRLKKTPAANPGVKKPGRGGLIAAVLGVMVLGAIGFGAYALSTMPPEAKTPINKISPTPSTPVSTATSEPSLPPPSLPVEADKVTLLSSPGAATVYRVGEEKELGVTPLSVELPASGEELMLVLRKEGFQDKSILLRQEDLLKGEITYELQPLEKTANNTRPPKEKPGGRNPKNPKEKPGGTTPPIKDPPQTTNPEENPKTSDPPKVEEGELVDPFSKRKKAKP